MPKSNIPTTSWESIIEEAARNMWAPKERAREVAAAILGGLRSELISRRGVFVKGFGKFSFYRAQAYYGQNPRTHAYIFVPRRWQCRFQLTRAINQRLKAEGPFS